MPPTPLPTRSQLLRALHELSDKDFAELFYDAVAGRFSTDVPAWRGHFVLADAARMEDEPWRVELIALPAAAERAAWGDDAPIAQAGTCPDCAAAVRCWAKRAECPVCGGEVACS